MSDQANEVLLKRISQLEENQEGILDSITTINGSLAGAFETISSAVTLSNLNLDEINNLKVTISDNTTNLTELKRLFESFSATTKTKLTELETISIALQRDMNEKVLPEIGAISQLEGDGENNETENEFVGDNQSDITDILT